MCNSINHLFFFSGKSQAEDSSITTKKISKLEISQQSNEATKNLLSTFSSTENNQNTAAILSGIVYILLSIPFIFLYINEITVAKRRVDENEQLKNVVPEKLKVREKFGQKIVPKRQIGPLIRRRLKV